MLANIFHRPLYTVTARAHRINIIHYAARSCKKLYKTRKSYGKDGTIISKILEAFAEDNLSSDPAIYRGDSEYRKALKVKYNNAETLNEKLDDEEKKLFEQYCNAQSDGSRIYEVNRFICGYKVGVLMMIEIFASASDLFLNNEEKTA